MRLIFSIFFQEIKMSIRLLSKNNAAVSASLPAGPAFNAQMETFFNVAANGFIDAQVDPIAASALVSQGLVQVGNSSGSTAQRPTGSGALFPGWIHIDTTLSKVVVFDGANWRDPITGAIT
jgi:hypothetical protein